MTGQPTKHSRAVSRTHVTEPRQHPDGVTRDTLVNAAESPLAWLYRRKGPNGRALISAAQFRAGETLRADFDRAGFSARVTSDWSAAPPGQGRKAGGRGPADLMDAALDARQRLSAALEAVGPDLAPLLEDVCCHLIGLEEAERKRGWPRRSGKVVLDLALRQLARHYGFQDQVVGRGHGTRSWGGVGFKPVMDLDERDDGGS